MVGGRNPNYHSTSARGEGGAFLLRSTEALARPLIRPRVSETPSPVFTYRGGRFFASWAR